MTVETAPGALPDIQRTLGRISAIAGNGSVGMPSVAYALPSRSANALCIQAGASSGVRTSACRTPLLRL